MLIAEYQEKAGYEPFNGWAVIVLTLITGAIHLFLGIGSLTDPGFMSLGILFIINAIGYAGLLAAVLGRIPFIPARAAHWLLMGFAAVTILAYFGMNGLQGLSPLALITKLDELLLIVAAFLHLRAGE